MTRYAVDDRSYIDRRVAAIDAATLEGPVRGVLGDPLASVLDWRSKPVGYDFLNPSSGGVYRFAGSANGAAGRVPWGLVLKITRAAESLDHGKPVPAELERSLRDAVRWDRELLAYESGFLESLAGGLAAATCYGWAQHDDQTAWLWLEDLGDEFGGEPWSLERWARVARELGRFNAHKANARDEWLGRGWLRTWVTKLTPFHFSTAVTAGPQWDEPRVKDAYPTATRERLDALWGEREPLLRAVEALTPVCSHLDSHRRNLVVRPSGVIAIDWVSSVLPRRVKRSHPASSERSRRAR